MTFSTADDAREFALDMITPKKVRLVRVISRCQDGNGYELSIVEAKRKGSRGKAGVAILAFAQRR